MIDERAQTLRFDNTPASTRTQNLQQTSNKGLLTTASAHVSLSWRRFFHFCKAMGDDDDKILKMLAEITDAISFD